MNHFLTHTHIIYNRNKDRRCSFLTLLTGLINKTKSPQDRCWLLHFQEIFHSASKQNEIGPNNSAILYLERNIRTTIPVCPIREIEHTFQHKCLFIFQVTGHRHKHLNSESYLGARKSSDKWGDWTQGDCFWPVLWQSKPWTFLSWPRRSTGILKLFGIKTPTILAHRSSENYLFL